METNSKSLQKLRQRKMFLIIPLLTLPFVTLLFWVLGGGKAEVNNTENQLEIGFNVELPNPKFEETAVLDKMSYYDAAVLDSLKMNEMIKNDPNYNQDTFFGDSIIADYKSNYRANQVKQQRGALNTTIHKDANEEKVYAKLEALQKMINEPLTPSRERRVNVDYENTDTSVLYSKDVDRLEQMMQSMNTPDTEDPEMQKLSGMLESILDIQHPERVQEKLRKQSQENKGQIFSINAMAQNDNITLLEANKNDNSSRGRINTNAFYSFDEAPSSITNQNAIDAVIHETQTLVNGSTVKLRLNQAIFVNGVLLPKDLFLFGTASLKAERLLIKITTIRYNNSIFPVELSVYDLDGIEGIYIPGAISRDVAKESADRSMQTLGISTLDNSLGVQAAGMGIEAAKNIISKKVKLIKVTIKAGYQILIRDENQKRNDTN